MKVLRFSKIFYLLSGALVLGSLLVFIAWGLKLGLDFTGGSFHLVRVIIHRPQVEADFIQPGIFQADDFLDIQQNPIGIQPHIDVIAEPFFYFGEKKQGAVEGQQGFTAADTGPLKPEAVKIIDVFPVFGKTEGIGGGFIGLGLFGGAVHAPGIADIIDKEAGPGAFAAASTARR